MTFAFVLGIICTLFKAIEIEVFWPLLMLYFVILVGYTLNKIVKKMNKYRYTLSDFHKKVQNLEIWFVQFYFIFDNILDNLAFPKMH